MTRVSEFKDQPHTQSAWWATGLGVASLVVPPLLGILGAVIRPIIDPASVNSQNTGLAPGLGGVVIALGLSVAALVVGIRALTRGERTWVLWLGLVVAALVALFWTALIISQFLFAR